MKNQEEYEKLISGLGMENFNLLIKEYAKDYYKTNELHISNGPYDGGLDLVIFRNQKEIKRNIQITITKTKIEEKLFEDVQKSKKNVEVHNYLSKLDFYISSNISQSKKQEYVRRAEIDYDIDLKIIDAKKLAGNMDEFPAIKSTLKKIYDFKEEDSIFEVSKQNKLLFNVISSGEDSTKIKRHLIHAYILTALFENPGKTINQLFETLKETITVDLDEDHLFQEINFLKSKKYIEGKDRFHLSENYSDNLQSILELNNIQEKDLTLKIDNLLNSKNIKINPQLISRKLIEMYVEHFQYEIEEFDSSKDSFLKSTRKIFNEISSLLINSGLKDKEECEIVAKEIINISSTNDFLTKIGASSMYVKLYNSEKLEDFINNSSRSVCLDTQVLLRLLCVLYEPTVSDHSLKAVYQFHQVISNSDIYLDIFTTEDYIQEVAAHLQKALKIYNYIKLPIFEKVGKTRNVFYNYYIELKSLNKIKNNNFREFIEKELLGISIPDEFHIDFLKIVDRRMIRLFENLNYEIISPQFYENYHEIKKKFEMELSYKNQIRSRRAIKHDVRTAIYMSDRANHFDIEEEIFLEPYIISWDYQFYSLRNILRDNTKDYNPWFVYTPQKFIEKLQLGSFKIKPESINETILAIVESDFNSGNNKKSFLDVISTIFNKENVGELKLAQKFANIEEEYLEEVESKDEFKMVAPDESPLTIILSILISYYNDPESENSMIDFTELCEDDSKADKLLSIVNNAINELKNKKLNKDKLIDNIDKLLNNVA